MRLVNAEYGIDINFHEGIPEILILEDEEIRRTVIEELWRQFNGEDGEFVLSDSKILKFDKSAEMIINPFSLDFQNRRITTALFGKMTAAGNEKIEEKHEINCALINLLDQISGMVNYPGITYQMDFVWMDLFKMYGVKIETQEEFLPRLLEYIKVISELCGITVIIFVGIKNYLKKEEIVDLYSSAEYNKINLLLIEPCETEKIESEHMTIIDKDRCLIYK